MEQRFITTASSFVYDPFYYEYFFGRKMAYTFRGSVEIQGDLTVTGNTVTHQESSLLVQDTIIGLGTPSPGSGRDGGMIIQRNPSDITNIDLQGTATAGSATSITISQTGFSLNYFTGWIVKITGGTGIGQNALVISSIDNVLTVPTWTVNPNNTSQYVLSRETNVAFIYNTASDQFFFGTTPSDHTQTTIAPTVPKGIIVKKIVQTQLESAYYVGKHGVDTNGGRTLSDAFLTFGAAIAAATTGSLIICHDNGTYAETITFNQQNLFAPNATIQSATIQTARAIIGTATTLSLTSATVKVQTFTTMTANASYAQFQRGGSIVVTGTSHLQGEELTGTTAITASGVNVYAQINTISSSTAVNIDSGFVVLNASYISSLTLAATNFSGIAHIVAGRILSSTTTGSGIVYYTDAKRAQDHYLNVSNPHNVTINQVSPLTTKGDIIAYSTTNGRFGSGSNGQILAANSAQPFGLEWINNSTTNAFETFVVAPGKYAVQNSAAVIGTFVWNQAEYSNLVNGKLVFYNTGALTLTFAGSITYVTTTILSAGYQSIAIVLPTADDLITLTVSKTGSSDVFIYNVVLNFGSAATTISASTGFDYKTVAGTYTVLTTDDHLLCNTSSAPVVLNLPTAFKKQYVIIDKGNAFTNNITINATGGALINGTSSYVIGGNYVGKTVVSDTVNWYVY